MQQKSRMPHVTLCSWMIHAYSYPYQLNKCSIECWCDQILAAFEVASSGSVEKYGISFATGSILFPGFSRNKCGVVGDQQSVKSLQGATVAALAASTAAKKNKERVIMALLHCSGGKMLLNQAWDHFLQKNSYVDLLCFFHIPFFCDTHLTPRYPASDCFAAFDPS